MKTIIAGSRDIESLDAIRRAVSKIDWEITEVVSGGARGIDWFALKYSEIQGIPFKVFNAEWKLYGKMAGPIRNRKMADYSQALVAIWDGKSRGTAHMIKVAIEKGLRVAVFIYREGNLSKQGST